MSNDENDPSRVASTLAPPDQTGETHQGPIEDQILSIANVAMMFGVSQLTLRYYELLGLIARRRFNGRQRVYSWADCDRLAFIIKCRRVSVPLRAIRTIIWSTDDDVSRLVFKLGQEKCAALVKQLERQRKVLDEALAELGHVSAMLTMKLYGQSEAPRCD